MNQCDDCKDRHVAESYLLSVADPVIAEHSMRFFKTAEGEYGHGDVFLGIRMPVLRQAVKRFKGVALVDVSLLLHSEYHEIRMFSLLLLVEKIKKADDSTAKEIAALYLANTRYINNWDLVDCSAHHIIGAYLYNKDRAELYRLAQSPLLWERRIAVIACFYFIKRDDFSDTLRLSEQLLDDREDLIHKAVGWMLREVGNRDRAVETQFLDKHYSKMPRTMLRYAIEKYDETERQDYLKGRR